MGFQKDFAWGVATAAYQIEGGADADGKGPSIWDVYERTPGNIKDGSSGRVACDHYHRYQEDVKVMKELGLNAYRFSVSWPRILPEGTGKVNDAGLDFYSHLVDALLANGITPYITLLHSDIPQAFLERGGWLNRDSPDWFARYAEIVVERLSDRVTNWFTMNEPFNMVIPAYETGDSAPGLKLSKKETFQITHNMLLAHGKAVSAIRAASKQPCRIGIAHAGLPTVPEGDSEADYQTAKAMTFAASKEMGLWSATWWLDPIFFGHYPADGLTNYAEWLPEIGPDDMAIISQPLDYFAINIYWSRTVRYHPQTGYEDVAPKVGEPKTMMGWPIKPNALYYGPKFMYERYKKPILIAENGMAGMDWKSVDGKVHDPQRIDFYHRYLSEYQRAVADGVEAWGFFAWTLMDNMEWNCGYEKRFGLVHVDFNTQERTIKDSGYWYRDLIKSNGATLGRTPV